MSSNKHPFRGNIAELVTPFESDGAIDWFAFDRLLERALALGYLKIAVCTAFGEGKALRAEEKRALAEEAVLCCKSRAQVIGGITGSSPEELWVAESYALAGVDGIYLEDPPTGGGLYRYVKKLTEQAAVPLILRRPSGKESLKVYPELFSIGQMAAVAEEGKRFSESMECAEQLEMRGIAGAVICCEEPLYPAMRTFGCTGVFSRSALLFAAGNRPSCRPLKQGEGRDRGADRAALQEKKIQKTPNTQEAQSPSETLGKERITDIKYAPFLRLFSGEQGSGNMKWLLHRMGLISPYLRLPLCEPDFYTAQRLEKAAEQMRIAQHI